MKKWIALVLALVLTFSLGAPAFAAGLDSDTGDVIVNVEVPDEDVYSVKIDWESMEFTYSFGKWDEETRTYPGMGWDKTEAKITVSNSSNVAITVTGTIAAGQHTVSGVEANLENAKFDLAMPAIGGAATSGAITVKVIGTPSTPADAENQVIGIVTVNLAKK